jgi:hypothetical protein
MANGNTDDKIHEIWQRLDQIAIHGCAKRDGDMHRIEQVEKSMDSLGRKLDRIFYTTLGTLAAMCAFLIKMLMPYMINK